MKIQDNQNTEVQISSLLSFLGTRTIDNMFACILHIFYFSTVSVLNYVCEIFTTGHEVCASYIAWSERNILYPNHT